jgi:hypothetical protein
MVVHLAFLYVMSALGSFKGMDLIPAPWDSVIVAVVSVGVYFWGVSSAMDYLRVRPFRRPNQAVEAAG